MNLSDLIDPARIVLGLRAGDKAKALGEVARRAGTCLPVESDTILQALLARERLGSTAFGRGFALPHVRLAEMGAPFGMLVRLARPIAFDAMDGGKVDILFALLLPQENGGDAIAALAAVSRCMRDDSTLRAIRAAADPVALYAMLRATPA